MDERTHDLFGHLAIGGHGVRKFGVEGEQRRQDCQKYKEQRGNGASESEDAAAVYTMRYADKESRHGKEPATPKIRHGRGSGGRVADMSLAGTHSAFSVPTERPKNRATCPKIRRRQGARRAVNACRARLHRDAHQGSGVARVPSGPCDSKSRRDVDDWGRISSISSLVSILRLVLY